MDRFPVQLRAVLTTEIIPCMVVKQSTHVSMGTSLKACLTEPVQQTADGQTPHQYAQLLVGILSDYDNSI